MQHSIYGYIAVMAITTYIIRALPLTIIRKQIKNQYFKDFLYYVPYATLSAMTFPAILYATQSVYSAAIGMGVALLLAYKEKSLIVVAAGACIAVYLVEIFL